MNLLDALQATRLVSSRSEAIRMLKQHAVKVNGVLETSMEAVLPIGEVELRIGKRRYAKLLVSEQGVKPLILKKGWPMVEPETENA